MNNRNELIRHALLETLALRSTSALPAPALRRRLATEVDGALTEEEITAALLYLQGLGYVAVQPDPLGATRYWQITTTGVQHYERGT